MFFFEFCIFEVGQTGAGPANTALYRLRTAKTLEKLGIKRFLNVNLRQGIAS
jgi:hypothetical protein